MAGLTRRMRAGEEAAYREFYEAYYNRLLRYLLVVSRGDEEGAAEALEGALLRVVRHIKVFASEEAFWSWLTVLARSAFSDHARKHRRYLAFLDRFASFARSQESGMRTLQPEDKMEAALDLALAALPADERQLLEWKYFSRRPVRDIAAELEVSEKAIESRLVRIRTKLKQLLISELKHD